MDSLAQPELQHVDHLLRQTVRQRQHHRQPGLLAARLCRDRRGHVCRDVRGLGGVARIDLVDISSQHDERIDAGHGVCRLCIGAERVTHLYSRFLLWIYFTYE